MRAPREFPKAVRNFRDFAGVGATCGVPDRFLEGAITIPSTRWGRPCASMVQPCIRSLSAGVSMRVMGAPQNRLSQ